MSTNLRTRSMHSFGAKHEEVNPAIQSDSSDESPSRKRVKTESEPSTEIHNTGNASVDTTGGNNDNSVITAKDFSSFDDFTPRRSSRTRSATSCYQAEPMKREEPPDQNTSESDSDSDTNSWYDNSQKCDISGEGSGRWHLVCESVADWVALSERFNTSSVACERKLYRHLTADLIPLVEGLFEEKVSFHIKLKSLRSSLLLFIAVSEVSYGEPFKPGLFHLEVRSSLNSDRISRTVDL